MTLHFLHRLAEIFSTHILAEQHGRPVKRVVVCSEVRGLWRECKSLPWHYTSYDCIMFMKNGQLAGAEVYKFLHSRGQMRWHVGKW